MISVRKRATCPAFFEQAAGLAICGHIISFPQLQSEVMFPDGFPGVFHEIAKLLVVGLAGYHAAIWLNAHII